VTPPIRQAQRCRPDQGGVIHMISGAAGRLSQVELPHPPHPRWAAVAQHHYVRFEWVARFRCLVYTVKDWHGTVIGYGMIPGRTTRRYPSWTTRNQGDRASAASPASPTPTIAWCPSSTQRGTSPALRFPRFATLPREDATVRPRQICPGDNRQR
jgi:hypothetical protein